jgi:hypothetical protein
MAILAVLGTGPSWNLFVSDGFDASIGVNDIWKYVKTDYVVCLDHPSAFTPERLKVIKECKPKRFYSQMVEWDKRPDFQKIDIIPNYNDTFCNLDTWMFQKSFCSPYVACQIAFKYHEAIEIHVFGVDLVNHPYLKQDLLGKIKLHFKHLKIALENKGCQLVIHGSGILTPQL